MYAVADLDAWADQRSFEATSDPEYAERHAGDTVMAADRRRAGGLRHVQPAGSLAAARTARPVPRLPGDMAPRDSQDLMAFPFFSLAKSRRTAPIDFRAATSRSAWKARRSTASPRYGMPTC
jgi:plasmid replication initiation protein